MPTYTHSEIQTIIDLIRGLVDPSDVDPMLISAAAVFNPIFSTTDTLRGTTQNDALMGRHFAEKLIGGWGHDLISGGSGDDLLYGGRGRDILSGGNGNDIIRGGSSYDLIFGDSGQDTVYGNAGRDKIYGGNNADRLYGGSNNDRLFGGKSSDKLSGGDGADLLRGNVGSDKVFGGNGNDRIYGDSGSDTLFGQSGDDTIFGGTGFDRIFGGAGNDVLWGKSGNDRIFGRNGNDDVFGGNGSDALYGGDGDDILGGGRGNDVLVGSDGIDQLFGDGGDNIAHGGNGNDLLYKQGDNDTFYGGNGDDEFNAYGGNGFLYGGADNDTFNLYGTYLHPSGNITISGGNDADEFNFFSIRNERSYTIIDFDENSDLIRLNGVELNSDNFVIDANNNLVRYDSNGDTTFVGETTQSGRDLTFNIDGYSLTLNNTSIDDFNLSSPQDILVYVPGTAASETFVSTIKSEHFTSEGGDTFVFGYDTPSNSETSHDVISNFSTATDAIDLSIYDYIFYHRSSYSRVRSDGIYTNFEEETAFDLLYISDRFGRYEWDEADLVITLYTDHESDSPYENNLNNAPEHIFGTITLEDFQGTFQDIDFIL